MRFTGNVIDAGRQIKIFVAAEKLAKSRKVPRVGFAAAPDDKIQMFDRLRT